MAVAHSILVMISYLLREDTTYQKRGEAFFEEQDREATERHLIKHLTRLGYQVELQPIAQAG